MVDMKNTLISCDVDVNGKKVTNKFVEFIVSVSPAAISLLPVVLSVFGILYLIEL